MSSHYFDADPQTPSHPETIDVSIGGRTIAFITDAGVFSRGELDAGTRLLIETLPDDLRGGVLDLGCGWGAVGVCVGTLYPDTAITMTDRNARATSLAAQNAKENGLTARALCGDGFEALDGELFDWILLNPPIRAGKQVIYPLMKECAEHLCPGGALRVVIRRQQGAESCQRALSETYPMVKVIKKSGGYWVLECRLSEA